MGKDTCGFEGQLLPLTKSELEWWRPFRLLLYLMGLGWLFVGIAVISDIFMASIEKVTSWKKRVKDKKTGRTVTIYIWNATVANLTLMALGSSAPEILLSICEISLNEMFLGDLGAGTIVGSAAFNLLVISAVCVLAIPDGEVRYIKQTTVYVITAASSVLAYLWLMFILMVWTPNVCTLEEGLLTLFFFPILIVLAFIADKGYIDKWLGIAGDSEKEPLQAISDDVTKDEIAQIKQQIHEDYGTDLSQEQLVAIMTAKYFTQRSRAYYHHVAKQKRHTQMARKSIGPPDLAVAPAICSDEIEKENSVKVVTIGWECARYAFLENCGYAKLILTRTGPDNVQATVKYRTRDGTATSKEDFEAAEGVVTFEAGQTQAVLKIKILDDNAYEENEEFYVDLSDPEVCDNSSCPVRLSELSSVVVVIIDDDDPGILRFKAEEVTVYEETEDSTCEIVVERVGGASGKISFCYNTEDMTAIAKMDYEAASGKIEMEPSVQEAVIPIQIKPKGRFANTANFLVRITNAVGCIFDKDTDGGDECCICHVEIQGKQGETRVNMLQRMESRIMSQQALLGHKHWKQQFVDALFKVSDDDDDDGEEDEGGPSTMDWIMHLISLPWKLLFAFVPPVDYCGGWLCFFASLLMIGVVTALVGDMANLVGACLGINPEITAITFVALGTSLPDTFASKTAASLDPYADASIGNITGSNSVNVFLGLGISWTMAALYWQTREPSEDWLKKVNTGIYKDVKGDVASVVADNKAVFVVPAGSLWFNLMVFSINAFFAIQHLFARRKRWGGELGGPKHGIMGQYMSASWLCGQWFIYIIASSIYATVKENSD
jgi:solute carrier family 8 (sodium/calcium exchanger)